MTLSGKVISIEDTCNILQHQIKRSQSCSMYWINLRSNVLQCFPKICVCVAFALALQRLDKVYRRLMKLYTKWEFDETNTLNMPQPISSFSNPFARSSSIVCTSPSVSDVEAPCAWSDNEMAGLFFPDVFFSMLGEASPETTSVWLPLLVSALFLIVPEDLPANLIAGRFAAETVFLSSVGHAESWTWIPMPELFFKVLLWTSARDVPSMQIAACWHSSLGLCICGKRNYKWILTWERQAVCCAFTILFMFDDVNVCGRISKTASKDTFPKHAFPR